MSVPNLSQKINFKRVSFRGLFWNGLNIGAEGGTRTRTTLRSLDPEPSVSTIPPLRRKLRASGKLNHFTDFSFQIQEEFSSRKRDGISEYPPASEDGNWVKEIARTMRTMNEEELERCLINTRVDKHEWSLTAWERSLFRQIDTGERRQPVP